MLAMRSTERNDSDAIRHLLSQQVSSKGTSFADFLGSHLSVIRCVDDDAQQRVWIICAKEADRLFKPEEEFLEIIGSASM